MSRIDARLEEAKNAEAKEILNVLKKHLNLKHINICFSNIISYKYISYPHTY